MSKPSMKTARSFALSIAILIVGTVLAAQGRGQLAAPAGLTKQTWTVDGVERSALVAAPRTPGGGAGSPLVFVFHGHGGSSAQASRSFNMHQAWPEAVVIYPQGLPTVGQVTDPQGNLPGWQHEPGGERDRDLHLVDAMFAWAAKTYSIDRTRVFAAGHSNGGSMVYVLWAAQPDRFAAFAPSSSVFKLAQVTNAKPKPAFIVAGQEDALVPFAAQQRSLRAVLRLNKAAADGVDWAGGVKKHASSIGADVMTYIHPGGHPMPADAGEMMAKFFKSVPLPSALCPLPY